MRNFTDSTSLATTMHHDAVMTAVALLRGTR
jgi:hypothetical protein